MSAEAVSPHPGLRRLHVKALGGSFGFLAANAAAGLLIARQLGPHGRGEVTYSFLLMSVGSTIGYFGIDYCATHLLAHNEHRTRPTVRLLFASSIICSAAAAVLIAMLSLLWRPPVAPFAVAIGIVGFTVSRVWTAGAFALGRGGTAAVLRAVTGFAYLAAVALLLLTVNEAGPVVWAWVGVAAVQAAVLTGVILRDTRPATPSIERATFRNLLRLGRASWHSSLAQLVTYRLDQVVVLYGLGSAALGRYSLAAFIMSLLWVIADSVGEVEHPQGATLKPPERLGRMKAVGARVVLLVGLLAAGLVAVSPFAVPVLVGPGYEEVPLLVAIFAPGTVVLAAGKVAGATLLAAGRTRALRSATILTAAIVAVGTYPAVHYGGIYGAAAFSSFAYTALGTRLWWLAVTTVSDHKKPIESES